MDEGRQREEEKVELKKGHKREGGGEREGERETWGLRLMREIAVPSLPPLPVLPTRCTKSTGSLVMTRAIEREGGCCRECD